MPAPYNVLQLQPDGEGHAQFTLGDTTVELVTRYNYSANAWTMDILDGTANPLVNGLMLTPRVNLLEPYPALTETLGGLLVVEAQTDAYLTANNLGTTVQLLWFPPGTPVVYP